MKSVFCFAVIATVAAAGSGYGQEPPPKLPSNAGLTKAMFMITGLH